MVFSLPLCTRAQAPSEAGSNETDKIEYLDLKTAQQMALKGSPSLAAAKARLDQARQRVSQARSAYWPRLDANFSAARAYLSETEYQSKVATARSINPFAAVSAEVASFKNGLGATWTLFDGFYRKYNNQSTLFGQAESETAHQEARRQLLASVASAFYNAQLALENITIAEANVDFNRRQLEDAQARQNAGTGSLSDVLNFEVRINAAASELIQARENYQLALFGLATLMGIPDAALPPGVEIKQLEETSAETVDLSESNRHIDYALKHRPDVIQGVQLVKQAQSNIGSARSGYFPTISLAAGLEGARTDDPAFDADDYGETVSLSLTYNLFAGGYTRAKVAEAKAKYSEAAKRLENLKINARAEVISAITSLQAAQQQLQLQQSNTRQVQQNRDLAQKAYAAGQDSLVRLNEAQRDLVTAQSRLALARVAQHQARENLDFATAQILAPFNQPSTMPAATNNVMP